MSMIRKKNSEQTGFQERAPYNPGIDVQCDFVMVYGTDESMPERVRQFREKGYVVHLMTGSAWGEYQDYLNGKWDGRNHWDESQRRRDGSLILHGKDVPYMVPAVSFSTYLTERLKTAVDAGVEAIHMEEPEFWDAGGYSTAFRREYELYYREPWIPPDESLDAHYRASKLKAYLYKRTLGRIGAALKEYAKVQYNRNLRFYIPTHSLVNYTQWKIMSPEASLLDIPCVDGYIAQVWTGTSRVTNLYEGVARERTFETAYLEYGIMQELVRGTNRKIWFLHDPIEDNPDYTWENYKFNYLKTVTASLLHPAVHNYEICPWPNRVFHGRYPVNRITHRPEINAKPIPSDYATLLCNLFQTLGDMDQQEISYLGTNPQVGVLMADSGLFQRSYPESLAGKEEKNRFIQIEKEYQDISDCWERGEDKTEESKKLSTEIESDKRFRTALNFSAMFPCFFGMTLPLLKYGLPVRPVQLDNIRRYPGYLDAYSFLVLSYEYMKPESPDINYALAEWIRSGGTLFYLGDGSDPYHHIRAWWNRTEAGYSNPAEHFFGMLGLGKEPEEGEYQVGKGRLFYRKSSPARICLTKENADEYRKWIRFGLKKAGAEWKYGNYLALRRGPYLISSVMTESVSEDPQILEGLFTDLYTKDFAITDRKVLKPGDCALLFDISRVKGQDYRIIGSSTRILFFDHSSKGFQIRVKGADAVTAYLRIRIPRKAEKILVSDKSGKTAFRSSWDEKSRTLLISFPSRAMETIIQGTF